MENKGKIKEFTAGCGCKPAVETATTLCPCCKCEKCECINCSCCKC